MEEQQSGYSKALDAEKKLLISYIKTSSRDEQLSCRQCRFSDQDIDTYPCDKCHTRH